MNTKWIVIISFRKSLCNVPVTVTEKTCPCLTMLTHWELIDTKEQFLLHKCKPQLSLVTDAAKSLQSCLTLCDPIDGSPPGSPVPGIIQARILEWVAISYSLNIFFDMSPELDRWHILKG